MKTDAVRGLHGHRPFRFSDVQSFRENFPCCLMWVGKTARKKRAEPLRGAWNSTSSACAYTEIGTPVQGACRVPELSSEKAPAVTTRSNLKVTVDGSAETTDSRSRVFSICHAVAIRAGGQQRILTRQAMTRCPCRIGIGAEGHPQCGEVVACRCIPWLQARRSFDKVHPSTHPPLYKSRPPRSHPWRPESFPAHTRGLQKRFCAVHPYMKTTQCAVFMIIDPSGFQMFKGI